MISLTSHEHIGYEPYYNMQETPVVCCRLLSVFSLTNSKSITLRWIPEDVGVNSTNKARRNFPATPK